MSEKQRLEDVSSWYLNEQLGVDRILIDFRFDTLKKFMKGPAGLELGPADGVMTRHLVAQFERLTVVDAALPLLNQIPTYPNLTKIHSLFEDFAPMERFNTIIMEHILEHVDDPVALLRSGKKWLAQEGRILAGVPNAQSIHRLAAVKMGLLETPDTLNPRDLAQGHRRVYTPKTFRSDIEKAGLKIAEMGGVFLKPLSNQQIEDHWSPQMIKGFYELGRDFPEFTADIYAVCTAS